MIVAHYSLEKVVLHRDIFAEKVIPGLHIRVFDETLFRIFAKHETRENSPVFRETFASFVSFARSNFRDFRVSRKLQFSRNSRN